jgi:hypothetical protein
MAIIGLLLMAAAVTFGIELVVSNTQFTTGEVFTRTVEGVTAGGFFLTGVIAGAVFLLGLAMLLGSLGRGRRKRAQRREVVGETQSTLSDLSEENAQLRRELADERRNRETLGGVAVPPAMAGTAGPYADQISDTVHKDQVADSALVSDPYPMGTSDYDRDYADATYAGKHAARDE